jgi:hypothetical protein
MKRITVICIALNLIISAPRLSAMDCDDPAFRAHKQKFQGVLYTIELARRIEAGEEIVQEEVKGMFGNALEFCVKLYYGDTFYKTIASHVEIPLYSEDGFVVHVPTTKKRFEISANEKFFYSYIYQKEDTNLHVFTVESLQNLTLGTTPINVETNKETPLTPELRVFYTKKLALIKAYNEWHIF